MKTIKLTQNQVALVDEKNYEELSKFKWYAFKHGYTFYAVCKINGKVTFMHNILINPDKGFVIDHKDRDGLNNCLSNLRTATKQQNVMNRLFRKPGKSKYLGVSWHKRIEKWQAQIQVNKKNKSLGYFGDEKEAAIKRDKEAKILFGEFAVLNFEVK